MPETEAPSGAALARWNDARPLDAALAYARLGWAVLPVAGLVGGHCGCRRRAGCPRPAKHPLVAGGVRAATTETAEIRSWWGHWPWAGVAIATGGPAHLVVVDLDEAHGATASLGHLDPERQPLPPTLTARTGGGWHRYYLADTPVPNAAGRLGDTALAGVDLRGEHGYVVAAPSPHPSGRRYAWLPDAESLAPLPSWIGKPPPPPGAERDVERAPSYARHALEAECDRVARAPRGSRNDTLNRAAFALGTLVGAGVLDEAEVTTALEAAALHASHTNREPLPPEEIAATIASGLRAGRSRPRRLRQLTRPATRVLARR